MCEGQSLSTTELIPAEAYKIVEYHLHTCPKCICKEVEECTEEKGNANNECDGYRYCGECSTNFHIQYRQIRIDVFGKEI